MSTDPAFGDATLTDCDRELIHVPGAVQAHGVLLVVSEPDLVIRQASLSLRRHLELNAERMLGRELALLLDADAMAAVRVAATEELLEPRYLPPLTSNVGPRMEGLIHRTAAGLILELEPYVPGPGLDLPQHFRHMLAAVHLAPSLAAMGGEAVRHLRAITGFDRVMLYRFLPDGAGEVIAEDRRDDLEPFLSLRYPASDIPAQARRLFVLNPLRVWAGTDGDASPLVPALNEATAAPLDMSRCVLRAASPIHLEYLRNMGVGASMALSIVQDGALWGLIACHHMTPRRVPHAQRIVLEALGHLLAVQIKAKESEQRSAEMVRLQAWTVATLAALGASGGNAEALRSLGPRLLQFVGAEGAAVHLGGRTTTFGEAPDAALIASMADWLGSSRPGQVFATDRLPNDPAISIDAFEATPYGLLAVPASRQAGDYVMWFRPEVVQTVTWAGDPTKAVTRGPSGNRLMPRGSFAAWADTMRGRAEPWSTVEVEAAQAFCLAVLEFAPRLLGDNAASDYAAARHRQGLLTEEVERRVADAVLAARGADEQVRSLVATLQSLAEGLRRS
jgi:light-regulated signal transduction histidine kinase (bacteriophytochrome)